MRVELSRNTQDKITQKIPSSNTHLQILNMKDESFTVDMEPLCNLSNNDHTLSSRITRSPSRIKESQKEANKKMDSTCVNEGDGDANLSSPNKGSLMAEAMPEKLIDRTTDHMMNTPQLHHQITIMTGGATRTTTTTTTTTATAITCRPTGTPTKSSDFWKRSRSFKQSSLINPRRILLFFATLSSIGTVLLICLTLSMSGYNEDYN